MVKFVNTKYSNKKLKLEKDKKKKYMVAKIVQIGSTVLFAGALISIATNPSSIDYVKSDILNTEISQATTSNNVASQFKDVDFEKLKNINKDVVGWIECKGTKIDYPVVQCSDNNYYLHHSIKKEENLSGTIFMDANNNKDFQDDITVIYGHNMKNNSMFGNLNEYSNQSYYDKHPQMYYHTANAVYKFNLFAAVNQDATKLIAGNYSDKSQFVKDMKNVKSNSSFKSKTKIDENSKVICLFTCLDTGSAGTNNRRLVYGTVSKVLDKTKQNTSSRTR